MERRGGGEKYVYRLVRGIEGLEFKQYSIVSIYVGPCSVMRNIIHLGLLATQSAPHTQKLSMFTVSGFHLGPIPFL